MTATRAAVLLILAAVVVAGGLWIRRQLDQQPDRGRVARQDEQDPTQSGPTARDGGGRVDADDRVADADRPEAEPGGGGADAASPDAAAGDPADDEAGSDLQNDSSQTGQGGQAAPWAAALEAPPQPHAAVRYRRMDSPAELLGAEDLKQWFEPFGPGGTIREQGTRRGATAAFQGVFRLRCPWPDQGVLRIGAENIQALDFRIHVFHQRRGALLLHTNAGRTKWTGYVTHRDSLDSLPTLRHLAADDAHRSFRRRRHDDGPIELHWRDGLLRLVSGDTTLVAVPLKEPPTDVYFEGSGILYGLEMVRCSSSPELPPRISADPVPLGRLPWNTDRLPQGAELEVADDGAVTLRVAAAKTEGWATAPLPAGFHQVQLELEGQDGVGVFLAGADAAPHELVRLASNAQDENRLSIFRTTDRGRSTRTLGAFPVQAPPSVAPRAWVALLATPQTMQWSAGVDGRRWASPDVPRRTRASSGAVLGLWHAGRTSTTLRVHAVRLAPWPALSALAEQLDGGQDDAAAEGQRLDELPPWEDAQHQAAGAVGRLLRGEAWSGDVATLVEAAQQLELKTPPAGQLLAEASWLLAAEGDGAGEQWLREQAVALASEAWRRDGSPPCSTFFRLWSRTHPSWVFPPHDFEPLRRLIRLEVLQLAHDRRWAELAELHRQLTFFRHPDGPLLDWAAAMAQQHRPDAAAPQTAAWQPAWVDEVDKATFNAVAELQGLIESDSWQAAAKLAATASLHGGLAPHPDDEQLLIGFGDRLRIAGREHPALADAVLRDVQPVAQLHVRRAIEEGRPQLVERCAVRFPLTPAAADAWRWLGDLALADGQWQQAVACYDRSLRDDPYAVGVEPKRQLALSLGGRGDPDWAPPADKYRWGRELSGEQVKQLVDGVRAAHPAADELPRPPPTSQLKIVARGRIEEPYGRDPRQQVAANVNDLEVDWCGRQLAAVWAGEKLVVCNRFQLAAFSAESSERLWQAAPPEDPRLTPQRARDLPLTPCRPATDGRLVAARLLYGAGSQLLCVDADSGQPAWSLAGSNERSWASDPLWHDGQLWVVRAVAPVGLGNTRLQLVQLRIEDGQQLNEIELGAVREAWQQRRHCQLTPLDRGLIICLDGAVLRADPHGVRWIRRHLAVPPEADHRGPLHAIQPPLVSPDGRRVIAHHPGWPAVQCLDVATGRLLWERFEPALAGVAAIHEGKVLAETDEHLACWRLETGETLWRRSWSRRCLSLAAEDGRIACLTRSAEALPVVATTVARRTTERAEGQPRHVLQWRRWSDGHVIESAPLAEHGLAEPRIGPLVRGNGAWWTFAGDGVLDATRAVWQLRP